MILQGCRQTNSLNSVQTMATRVERLILPVYIFVLKLVSLCNAAFFNQPQTVQLSISGHSPTNPAKQNAGRADAKKCSSEKLELVGESGTPSQDTEFSSMVVWSTVKIGRFSGAWHLAQQPNTMPLGSLS